MLILIFSMHTNHLFLCYYIPEILGSDVVSWSVVIVSTTFNIVLSLSVDNIIQDLLELI